MIYGLDMGTRRMAVACAQTGDFWVRKLRTTGANTVPIEESGLQLGRWLSEELPIGDSDTNPSFFAERPFVGRPHGNVRTAVGQALTLGGVLAQAPGPIFLIEQAEWKKAVVGSGNASKEAIAIWLSEHHTSLSAAAGGDQDVIDAFCISLYGRGLARSCGM